MERSVAGGGGERMGLRGLSFEHVYFEALMLGGGFRVVRKLYD